MCIFFIFVARRITLVLWSVFFFTVLDNREFVGRLSYGVVYDLWNPTEHMRFGNSFRHLALTLFACQRRIESPLCTLPDDCIFYILNMCRWDWVDDSFDSLRGHRMKMRSKLLLPNAGGDATPAVASVATCGTTESSSSKRLKNED